MPELQIGERGVGGATILDLITQARENPATPIMQDLFHEFETAGLHGSQESFKTIWTLQLAESLATGTSFLGVWPVPRQLSVFFFETEMSAGSLGARLKQMFSNRTPPTRVSFATDTQLKRFKRAGNLEEKFEELGKLLREAPSDVLIIDTCNPFFRGKESANDETAAGSFFDRLDALPVPTKLFVRHNHKPRIDDQEVEPASRIRGSGQFADVPDLLFELRRSDKRNNGAKLAVTKFRHGTKPKDLDLWFDAGQFRLISIPPVIELLKEGPLCREKLLAGLEKRFGIAQRNGDDKIKDVQDWLLPSNVGHRRVLEIDLQAAPNAEWYSRSGLAT